MYAISRGFWGVRPESLDGQKHVVDGSKQSQTVEMKVRDTAERVFEEPVFSAPMGMRRRKQSHASEDIVSKRIEGTDEEESIKQRKSKERVLNKYIKEADGFGLKSQISRNIKMINIGI